MLNLEDGHGVHAEASEAPVTEEYVFSPHKIHDDKAVVEYVPAGHDSMLKPLAQKEPAEQSVQMQVIAVLQLVATVEFAPLYWPARHTNCVGTVVGTAVGNTVGKPVTSGVGTWVGGGVGAADVGIVLGGEEGRGEGTAVGARVGADVGRAEKEGPGVDDGA